MRRTTTSLIAAVITSTALLAGGCSGGDDGAAVGDPSTPDSELTYTSPLAQALNLGDAPDLAAEQQEQVAQCMADRGWDYTPVKIPGGIEDELGSMDEYGDLFNEGFRTRWGYGLSTIYADDGGYADGAPTGVLVGEDDPNQDYIDSLSADEQSRYYTDLFGADVADGLDQPADEGADATIPGDAPAGAGAGEPGADDPNVGSDSDLDADADADADGGGPPESDGTGLEQFAGSCTLAGMDADGTKELARLEQLSTKLAQASADLGIDSTAELVKTSPELEQAQKDWAACMDRAGHRVATVDEPEAQLSERLDQVLFGELESPEPDLGGVTSVPADDASPGGAASDATAPDPAVPGGSVSKSEPKPEPGGDSEVVAGGGDDEAGAGGPTSGEQAFDPAEVDLAALKKLQADELAMAADDRDCQAEYFRPVYLEVRSTAEQRFVDRNGDMLEELSKLSGLG